MKDILKNEILDVVINSKDNDIINYKISKILSKYDIRLASKELVPWSFELPACYKAFMVNKKIEGCSDLTLAQYKQVLEEMLRKFAKPVEQITKNDIVVYLFQLQEDRKICNRTLDSKRSVLSSFFGWISCEGYISRNPMQNIHPIKYDAKERCALTGDDLERVRMMCKDVREKAIVEFLYSTACRVSELTNMNITDVNFVTNEVVLFGKGSKYRKSYLTAKAKLYLQEYLNSRIDDNTALFVCSRKPHKRLSKTAVERIVKSLGKRCNLHLHPHLFRHTAATDALQNGMDITQVQRILGHCSLETTMIYAKVAQKDVAASHQKFIH